MDYNEKPGISSYVPRYFQWPLWPRFPAPLGRAMIGTREKFMPHRLTTGKSLILCLSLMFAAVPAIYAQATAMPDTSSDVSGMYSFLREGEFVQLTVEDGQLSGFVSRFGESDSDKSEFIDHFFDKATLQGDRLSFKTKTIHAVWYEFDGTTATVAGKQRGQEGYRVLRGKLTLHQFDATGKEQVSQRTVEFKSFPDAEHIRNSR